MLPRTHWQKWLLVLTVFLLCLFYLSHTRKSPPTLPLDTEDVSVKFCNATNLIRSKLDATSPVIFFVTPTYTRREQYPELLRLSQTLLHVKNLIWIVVEDASDCSAAVSSILNRYPSIPFAHLASAMPKMYLKAPYKPRGVSSRNAALDWIEQHKHEIADNAIVYFADDDNTYDLRLFEEIRSTQTVSMFPVGLIGEQGISSPIVRGGKVIGFSDPWFEKRHFPVDMAGFAFNWRMMEAAGGRIRMPYKAGHEEDLFLRRLNLKVEDIEPKAKECTQVLVWHTQTVKKEVPKVSSSGQSELESLNALIGSLESQGVIRSVPRGRRVPVCLEASCPSKKT